MMESLTPDLVTGTFSGVDHRHLNETPVLSSQSGSPVVSPPREPMLSEMARQRPRMFLTAEDVAPMRQRMATDRVQRYYMPAGALEGAPPPFVPGQRNGGSFRNLPGYALSHLLVPSEEKLDRLIVWLRMAATYPHVGADLDAEYFVEGVALTYDWLYQELPDDVRGGVRDLLCRQARHILDLSLVGRTGGGLSYQQNHYWFAHLALVFASAAVFDEIPEARDWLAWAWDRCERIFLTLGPDGGFHEGPGYWDFSMPVLYMLVDLYEQLTGLRVPSADQGLKGQAVFRLHHLNPGMAKSVMLEDTTANSGRPPVQLLLWEAKRYGDSVAMGIADLLVTTPGSRACDLLWLDEDIEPQAVVDAIPPVKHYSDIETVFARTSWRDDATSLAAVSRPLGGHFWAGICDTHGLGGTGHNHPEQGHFTLFGRGETLAADPGYTYEKRTRNHNTILVDGEGQSADGEMWPRPTPGRARVTGMASQGDITIVAADPCSAYPAKLSLTRFERTLVLAGRNLVVIHDRLAAGESRTFSWLLHHIGNVSQAEGESRWLITRGGAQLLVAPLQPAAVSGETSTYLPVYVHPTRDHTPGADAELGLVELKTEPSTEATFLVPLLLGDTGAKMQEALDFSVPGMDAVRVGDTVVAFNRGSDDMIVPMPDGGEMVSDARAIVADLRDGERRVVTLA